MSDFEARVVAAAQEWAAEGINLADSRKIGDRLAASEITPERAMQFVAQFYGGGVAIFRRDVEIGGF